MKKLMSIILTAIMAATMIGGATVNTQTGDLEIETEMLWGRYNPNPAPITEEQLEQIILGALK